MQVIGFSDAERHALNTLFRLSEGREPTYAAWAGVEGEPGQADVVLVDGESAEAVLAHVREERPGQRLIWVGGAFTPPSLLPGPLQTLVYFNPMFYLIDGFRYAMTGVNAAPVWASLLFTVAAAVVSVGVVLKLFQKGYKLRV